MSISLDLLAQKRDNISKGWERVSYSFPTTSNEY